MQREPRKREPMSRGIRDRLSYANVIAALALFVALGGSSYAALKLPRNSVGSQQIRTGAVASSEVKDRSLQLQDISKPTRERLAGKQGPPGAQGPAGQPGAPAARFFAAVSAAGQLVRGTASSGGSGGAVGSYTVGFAQDISACVYTATLGSTDGSDVPPGRITVSAVGGKVAVKTFDAAGSPADLPFHLIVAC